MVDIGLTHIALPVRNVDRSAAFYARFADMREIHRRTDTDSGHTVVWLSDGTRPFAIVLVETDGVPTPLAPIAHLGVGCKSRAEVDARVARARAEAVPVEGPDDYGPPVGYWAFLRDPDGHTLELSFGQDVALTVAHSLTPAPHARA